MIERDITRFSYRKGLLDSTSSGEPVDSYSPIHFWLVDVYFLIQQITQKPSTPLQLEKEFYTPSLPFHKYFYDHSGSSSENFEDGQNRYQELLYARDYFASLCHTLIHVEQQQEAKEIAERSANCGTQVAEDTISEFFRLYV